MTTSNKNKVLSKEEKFIIQGIINGKDAAKERIINDSKKIMYKTIRESKVNLDYEEKEDLVIEFMIKVLEEIPKNRIKKDLFGYIKIMSKNHLADHGRKKITKKTIPIGETWLPVINLNSVYDEETGVLLTDKIEDPLAKPPGSKEYHESEDDTPKHSYYAKIPLKTRQNIERSLEVIEELYRFKEQVRIAKNKYDTTHRIHKDLEALKEKIKYIAGRSIRKKASRYEYLRTIDSFGIDNKIKLSESERKELEEFENLDFDGMLPIKAYAEINELIRYAEIATFFNLRYPSRKKFFDLIDPLSLSREDMNKKIPDMRIEPPRLMYAVWSMVPELRRGIKEVNHKKMSLIFAFHKIATKNTHRMFLFESVRNDLSNYETIRKIQYYKPKSKVFYNKLVENIYKISF